MKNYIGYVNDHSGSMSGSKARAAIVDYNANITATKDAASREMLDTVVSVVAIGFPRGQEVTRQVVISNPHVLKPVTEWPTPGGTPLWDGIANMIELFDSLPDANNENVSFLVITTTDGNDEYSRKVSKGQLAQMIQARQRTGRWTFVFRVPVGSRRYLEGLGVPSDNIVEWENSAAGMEKATAQTTAAMNSYYTARSAGAKSSSVFYAQAANVDVNALKKLDPKDFSLYVVPAEDNGIEIQPFVLRHRMQYLKGAAFYQLTKTEARITPTKLVAVRDRANGNVYTGPEARKMIGLSTTQNARLHPGDHGNFDIFIQSESINRKLVGGTGLLYVPGLGTMFTAADLAYLKPKPAAPAVVQLPAVPVSTKPTPSPIPPAKKAPAGNIASVDGKLVKFFEKRDVARAYYRTVKSASSAQDLNDFQGATVVGNVNNYRWFVFI